MLTLKPLLSILSPPLCTFADVEVLDQVRLGFLLALRTPPLKFTVALPAVTFKIFLVIMVPPFRLTVPVPFSVPIVTSFCTLTDTAALGEVARRLVVPDL